MRRGGGDGGLVVRFKWIALSLVVPSPKHYNASASDLHLSGAPNTSTRQGTLVVVLSTKTECVPRSVQRLDNCRLNVQSTLNKTVMCACVCVCCTALILPLLFYKTDCSSLHTCACCIPFLSMSVFTHAPRQVKLKSTKVPSWFRC